MKTAAFPAILVVLLAAACGAQTGGRAAPDPNEPGSPARPTRIPAATGEVTATGTVMDTGRPELCLGAVAESYPPQCGGPPILGWDWEAVDGEERSGDTRWGTYTVTGTFDGSTFTLTQPPRPPAPIGEPDRARFATPCPEPDGGWRVVDPAKTSPQSLGRVFEVASQLDGYAGAWMDQSINPAYDAPTPPEEAMNDPALTIVNVRVTGDPAAAEAQLRQVWGGALCVSTAKHPEAELLAIQQGLSELPGILSSEVDRDRVAVTVVHDDGSLQRWADAEYGDGLVEITSALQPAG